MITRRNCLVGMAGLVAVGAGAARAAVQPVVAYADGLMPGWWIGGWSKTTANFGFADGTKPIEVTMAGWNGMTLQTNTPLDTSPFTVLTMVVNGGEKGRQEFELTLKKGDKVVSEPAIIDCDKGQWVRTDVPLKKMRVKDQIDTIMLTNKSADAMEPFYLNYVLFQ